MCKGKAQNRIEYIVYNKPAQAAKIIGKYGYEAPRKKEHLASAVKMLVKRKGEAVIKELIQIHPEKDLILQVTGHSEESNFCGCSAYDEETKNLLNQLSGLSEEDLTHLYDETKEKAKEKPGDKKLSGQLEAVWDELKRKKKQKSEQEKHARQNAQTYWMQLGLAFFAGIVIAKIS